MRSSRTLWPVSLPLCVAAGVLATAATLAASKPVLMSWKPPLWVDVSAVPREALVLLGPCAASLGAAIGHWRHTLAVGPAPGRGWAMIARRQLTTLALALLVGCAVGLTPAIVIATARSTGGELNTLVVLGGWACVLVSAAVGFVCGVVWRSRLTVAVVPIAVYLTFLVPVMLTDV